MHDENAGAITLAGEWLRFDPLDVIPQPFRWFIRRSSKPREFWVNIPFSLEIKFVFLLMVMLGTGSMWMAILADVGTSILVTLNGTRLLYRDFNSKVIG